MTPLPPPPPLPELAAHQAAQIAWGVKQGYLPPTPPPPLVQTLVVEQGVGTIVIIPQEESRKRINVRAKGQRGEREVVKLLQEVVDKVRRRFGAEPLVLQRNSLQAHLGGADIHGLDGFAIEVKVQEAENIPGWWRQAIQQAEALSRPNRTPFVPVLFYRRNGRPWSVKWRAFVLTPRDRDNIELDVEADLSDFLDWFENAYDEALTEWAQTLK